MAIASYRGLALSLTCSKGQVARKTKAPLLCSPEAEPHFFAECKPIVSLTGSSAASP